MEKKLLAIELTDNLARYVYLEKAQNAYHILKAGTSDYSVDFINPEGLTQAITNILTKEKIFPDRLFITVSRKDVFIHQLVIPQLSNRQLDEVIATEIEKIPEFLDKEFDYVYRMVPNKRDNVKVFFSVLLRDRIDFIVNNLRALRLACFDLEVSPMNLRQVLLSEKVAKEGKAEAVLTIFENHSQLSIYNHDGYRVFYKLPIGILQLISRERVLTDSALVNFTMQLRRMMKAYSAEYKEQIEQLWLVWDKDILAKLPTELAAQLEVKVEPLTLGSIREITASHEQQLNPVFLLALTPIIHHLRKIKSDFSLEHFLQHFNVKAHIRQAVLTSFIVVGVAVAGLVLAMVGINNGIQKTTQTAASVAEETSTLKEKSQNLYDSYYQYSEARERLLKQAQYVQQLNRISWSEVLALVANELPEDVGFTSFEFYEAGSARIRGEALLMEPIAGLIRRIDQSVILEKGKFDYLRERNSGGTVEKKYFEFGIMAQLKAPKEEATQ